MVMLDEYGWCEHVSNLLPLGLQAHQNCTVVVRHVEGALEGPAWTEPRVRGVEVGDINRPVEWTTWPAVLLDANIDLVRDRDMEDLDDHVHGTVVDATAVHWVRREAHVPANKKTSA